MNKRPCTVKNQGYVTLVLLLFYLAIEQIPWRRFFSEPYAYESLFLGARFLYCFVVVLFLIRYSFSFEKWKGQWPKALLFVPFLALVSSNFVGGSIEGASFGLTIPVGVLVIQSFSTLFLAFLEEVIFRFLLFTYLSQKMKKWAALLLSSAIFGLLHFINLLGGADIVSTLQQVGYSFFNGLVCGLMWGYGGGMVLPIVYHALFNFFQGDLFRAYYQGNQGTPWLVTNLVFGAVFAVYGVALFLLLREKHGPVSAQRED